MVGILKKTVLILIIIATILAMLCGWLYAQLSHVGFNPGNATDELTLLGVLATIVGAILAGAGIIVALVAISTMWNVEERLEKRSADIEANIREEIKKLNDQNFIGFDRRLQSLNMSDLETAERLMQEAIKLYPNQEAARSAMAFKLFGEVQRRFVEAARLLSDSGLGSIPLRRQTTGPLSNEALQYLTMKWLDRAIQHGDDPDGEVSLWRAELYGMWGRTNDMIQDLRSSVNNGILTTELYAVTYYDVAPLLLSVHSKAILQDIGTILGQQFPIGKDKVLNYARTSVGRMGAHIAEFLVQVKPDALREKLPRELYILSVGFADPGFRISWAFVDHSQGSYWAELPPRNDPDAAEDEVWKLIEERFWVIMPITDHLGFPDQPDFDEF